MTTPEAAARYLAEYQREVAGRPIAIYNPQGKPIEELPVIYGFNNGGRRDWLRAQLTAEDGTPLGSHICSDEAYMPGDLGVIEGTRPDRHEDFRKHYPDGYRMEFVRYDEVRGHARLMAAIEKATAKGAA